MGMGLGGWRRPSRRRPRRRWRLATGVARARPRTRVAALFGSLDAAAARPSRAGLSGADQGWPVPAGFGPAQRDPRRAGERHLIRIAFSQRAVRTFGFGSNAQTATME